MIKRLFIGIALLAGLAFSSLTANADCVPGRIEVDPRTGTVVVELPKCPPPPSQ